MLIREKGITDFSDINNPGFGDVKPIDSSYNEIAKAVELGIINGKVNEKGDKIFDPSGTLTRSEMAKILSVSYELVPTVVVNFTDVSRTNWAYPYIQALASNYVTVGYGNGKFGANDAITRSQFAVMMARTLDESFREEVKEAKPELPPKTPPVTEPQINREIIMDSLVSEGFYKATDTVATLNPFAFGGQGYEAMSINLKSNDYMRITLINWVDDEVPQTKIIPEKLQFALNQLIPSGSSHIYNIASHTAVTGTHTELNKTFNYDGYNTKVVFNSGAKPTVQIIFTK